MIQPTEKLILLWKGDMDDGSFDYNSLIIPKDMDLKQMKKNWLDQITQGAGIRWFDMYLLVNGARKPGEEDILVIEEDEI